MYVCMYVKASFDVKSVYVTHLDVVFKVAQFFTRKPRFKLIGRVNKRTYIHTCMHTYVHTYIHTYIADVFHEKALFVAVEISL